MDIKRSRPNWSEYFLKIALDVAQRGTCLRRCFGAVIVDTEKRIVSTGYCGSPVGEPNCCDIGECERKKLNVPSGERYELCKSVHAEANAIIQAPVGRMRGGTIYIAGFEVETRQGFNSKPCAMCRRIIINSGLDRIVYIEDKKIIFDFLHGVPDA